MWKQGLSDFFSSLHHLNEDKKKASAAARQRIEEILQQIIIPTMGELAAEFETYGRQVQLTPKADCAVIDIYYNEKLEMTYGLKVWAASEDTYWISSLRGARTARAYKSTLGENIKDFVIDACLKEYYDTMRNLVEQE